MMKTKLLCALGIAQLVLVLMQPQAAFSDDQADNIRYSCYSPGARYFRIENQAPKGKTTHVVQVENGIETSFKQTGTVLSKADPNDIIVHFDSRALNPQCDVERNPPAEPGAKVIYGASCYLTVHHELRVDVANPHNSSVVMRNAFGEVSYKSPLKCVPGSGLRDMNVYMRNIMRKLGLLDQMNKPKSPLIKATASPVLGAMAASISEDAAAKASYSHLNCQSDVNNVNLTAPAPKKEIQ